MAKLIKCKICGDTEFTEVGELLQCRSCKHKTPKPKENAELLERANNLRFETKSFDEAANLYEEIIRITPDEAEAYWGRVLCRYGIEYVKDSDGRYLPTCHRTWEGSILDDGDYKMAVMKAERGMSEYYMSEAQTIDEYQKKIKIIAAKESPYDVFISFKATDEYGRPTEDSLLAQELYYYLTKNLGLKVFFSNITLKDKAGQEYEPIIYAALSSATVMVLVGTKPEYINATWVKNEWSRYVKMVATARTQNKSKYIVTALKDMRPEQLPSVLASYQAVNLAELGAKEKLCSNIDSLIGDLRVASQKSAAPSVSIGANDVLSAEAANLCDLGYQQLMMKDLAKANEYFQKAIEKKSSTALAHWGMLLVSQGVSTDEELADKRFDIKAEPRYKLAMQYASAEEKMRFERVDSLVNASLAREASVYCDRGFESLKGRDFEGAETLFEKALAIKSDMSRAHWGMLLVVEEACDDEDLSARVGSVEQSEHFASAMANASVDERLRYRTVVEKMKESGLAEAQACLDRADACLQSDTSAVQKDAAKNIILAIHLKNGDIPAKYYWNWLRLFMGAKDEEGMAQMAYPVKWDIFYKRAMERADSREAAKYERIADRCQTLYNIKCNSEHHYMRFISSVNSVYIALGRGLFENEKFAQEMKSEMIISHMARSVYNTCEALDAYMMKYITNIIPDPYDDIEDENEFGRYKYLKKEKVSLYLASAGKNPNQTALAIKEKLGYSWEEAQNIAVNAPCYIGHNITAEIAQDVLTSINGKNRTNKSAAFIHVAPLNDIIKNHEHEYPKDSERVAVYLTGSSRKNPKDTVKFLRDRCNMDKREAKEAAENTSSSFENKNIPVCLATGLPLSEARTLLLDVYDQLEDGKAEYRWQ